MKIFAIEKEILGVIDSDFDLMALTAYSGFERLFKKL